MRLIDAEPVEQELFKLADKALGKNPYEKASICAYRRAFEMVVGAPSIAPQPNEPLTMDELREMDGEPVWLRCDTPDGKSGYWCLCENGIIVMPGGLTMDCRDVPRWELYRCKPEEEQHG